MKFFSIWFYFLHCSWWVQLLIISLPQSSLSFFFFFPFLFLWIGNKILLNETIITREKKQKEHQNAHGTAECVYYCNLGVVGLSGVAKKKKKHNKRKKEWCTIVLVLPKYFDYRYLIFEDPFYIWQFVIVLQFSLKENSIHTILFWRKCTGCLWFNSICSKIGLKCLQYSIIWSRGFDFCIRFIFLLSCENPQKKQ